MVNLIRLTLIKLGKGSSGKTGKNFSILGKYRKWEDHPEEGNHVVPVNPTMRGNIGNVVRPCAALGVNNIAVIAESFDSFLPEVIRTSIGIHVFTG